MPTEAGTFDLQATINAVLQALSAVVCNIGFQVATVGLIVALIIGSAGVISLTRGKRTGKPLLAVSRKMAIFCVCLSLPGVASLVTQGRLPAVNQLVLHPFGLFGFWGLVTAHLCMEEMNYQWFPLDK
jgi:hypothetical protein